MSKIIIKHRFEVLDTIGDGKYSTVYKAMDNKKQRLCAAKIVILLL